MQAVITNMKAVTWKSAFAIFTLEIVSGDSKQVTPGCTLSTYNNETWLNYPAEWKEIDGKNKKFSHTWLKGDIAVEAKEKAVEAYNELTGGSSAPPLDDSTIPF